MKKSRLLFIAIISTVLFITESCKKRQEFNNETGTVSEDLKNIQSGLDIALSDANIALSTFGKSAPGANIANICGATADTSQINSGILKLIFDDSTNCNGRIRSGTITLTIRDFASGKRWRDVGAVLDLTMTNYKIKMAATTKYVILNGSKIVTNVSGGNSALLIYGQINSLIHTVSGNNIIAQFEDGTSSNFNIARQYTHTYSNMVYELKGEGVYTQDGKSKIEKWGTTRDGSAFTSQALEPVIWNSTCGPHRPVSGELDIKVDSKDFSLLTTFGVDSRGISVTDGCAWGFKVEWSKNNRTGSKLFQYN
jgi:hypothetical protein